ncbi:hypothetical protein [Paenibacillus tianjinensis]|uniref:IrrE N-terminal-like domain-containing protein n=1 Tax=Paenibacillus tianjinensis TaxID=2810347 RepID=A0ABX7L5W4_9BACL|nr:hypothetical protein [Paenibacillus tianjinensis]QSF43508.1 hypothetical protein JRJ22_19795 [Paenibacillus tianjinensis]
MSTLTQINATEIEYILKDFLSANSIHNIYLKDTYNCELGSFLYDDFMSEIEVNISNVIEYARKHSLDPVHAAKAILCHELGHYIDFTTYNGIQRSNNAERATGDRKARLQRNLELSAYRHGKQFITTDFAHAYEVVNEINLQCYTV